MEFKKFSNKQTKALSWWHKDSPYENYDALICDGAIRSGKTLCMGISFVAWAFYRFNKSNFAICGKTIRSIKRNFITPILPVLSELGFNCNYKISENLIEISSCGRINKFYLFGGRDESSASLIQGMTLSGVLFDEVALMPKSFVEQALARCSVEGSKFWFNCNPEYPQHWFNQEWILKTKEKNVFYLHFKMDDNPSLSKEIKERYEKLYTGAFYERFIEGRWVVAQGIVYPDMSNPKNFYSVPDVNFERYYVSCDYGTVNPASFGLWGEYDGVFYRISEYYYDSRKVGFQRTDEEHYIELCNLTKDLKIEAVTVDPSAASFITLIKRYGKYNVILAKNNVVDGIRQVSTALKNKSIRICNNCTDSMCEFGMYRWEDSLSRDVPVKENDHAMDDIRYFVTTLMLAENEDDFFVLSASRS
ncbi:MAG: hypothetical protein RUMPE_00865 [Eubacteriales bacterium SKADARSKE-1]|nr:hypothetical protein [Eubacteriales bacterium SKADARSKE-1]